MKCVLKAYHFLVNSFASVSQFTEFVRLRAPRFSAADISINRSVLSQVQCVHIMGIVSVIEPFDRPTMKTYI